MKRIGLLLLLSLAACTKAESVKHCEDVDVCDDGDDCTTDACTGGACVHTDVMTAECQGACEAAGDCDDGNDCTTDDCNVADGVCAHDVIAGCGGCVVAADCDDHDACTTEDCSLSECGHTPVDTVACGACENDGVCDVTESCVCADCATQPHCVAATGCTEILAPDVTAFNEGPVTDADGNGLEGAGLDILQAFASGAPEGVVDLDAIADHDECFSSPGCAQLRLDYNTAAIEGMATTGAWEHHADGSGELYNVTFVEYTQGTGGVMEYVAGGRCWHLDHAHHEN